MTWVLDWDRVLNLLVVLTPFFVVVGGACKWLVDRSDRARKADEEEREERRGEELLEMRESRAAFYSDVLREATRMRELYEAEMARGLGLRTALAEAAQREMKLQQTIIELTGKVDRLQDEVSDLRNELADARRAREAA